AATRKPKFATNDLSNMLFNPDFEDDDQNWSVGQSVGGSGVLIVSNAGVLQPWVRSGQKSMQFGGNGGFIAQSVPVKEGVTYYVSAPVNSSKSWLPATDGVIAAWFDFRDINWNNLGGPLGYTSVAAPLSWTDLKMSAQAPKNASTVSIIFQIQSNTTGAIYIDSVYMSRQSTPGELPLDPSGPIVVSPDGKAITAAVEGALQVVNQVIQVKGKGITTSLVNDFAIAQQQLADAAVATSKIADSAVTNLKLGALAVANANMQNASVSTAIIQNGAITNLLVQDSAITTAKIGDLQVTTAKIASLEVAKLLAGTVSVAISLTAPTIQVTAPAYGTINLDPISGLQINYGGSVANMNNGKFTCTAGSATAVMQPTQVLLSVGTGSVSISNNGSFRTVAVNK